MLLNRESLPDRSGDKMVELGDVELSIEPSTLVSPAEIWSCRTRRQKPK
jgi:hypothetical protein